jgi:hypothetical protein
LRAGFQRAFHKSASGIAAIFGGGTHVVYGRKAREMVGIYDAAKARPRRLADEGALEFSKAQRSG